MTWWNPKTWGQQKSVSDRERLSYFVRLGSANWSAHEFALFVQEGYSRNPMVRRCASLIAKSAAGLPLKLTQNGDTLDQPNHPLMQLLRKPNPEQSWSQFCEEWFLFRGLSGEGPLRAITVGGQPRELWVLRPDWLSLLSYRNGLPYHWQYTEQLEGQSLGVHNFYREDPRKFFELALWKEINPLHRFRGLSPLVSAAFAVDTMNAYAVANKAVLDNGVTPSGVFTYKPKEGPGTLNDTQYKRLKGQINDTHAGARNTGKPILLEGGLEWQATGLSPREMEYIAGKKLSSLDVCIVYGVPAQMVGLEGSQTFANYDQARMSFYEDTVIPLAQDALDFLVNWLGANYKEQGLRVEVDVDAVNALAPRRVEARKAIESSTVLKVNEKRTALGYEEIPEGDVVLVGSGLIPLDLAGSESEMTPEEAAAQAGIGKKPRYNEDDDVVAEADHMEAMKGAAGRIVQVKNGPYYAVEFDHPMEGVTNPHKWLAEDEIRPAEGEDD